MEASRIAPATAFMPFCAGLLLTASGSGRTQAHLGLDSCAAMRYVRPQAGDPAAGRPVYIGSGWGHTALWLTLKALAGFLQELERGWIGAMREFFSVVSRGRNVMGMCAAGWRSDARCASLALSHLSLSLSLGLALPS